MDVKVDVEDIFKNRISVRILGGEEEYFVEQARYVGLTIGLTWGMFYL